VSSLPTWHFLILGRGWKKFLKTSGLINNNRVQYEKFNFLNRNKLMPKAQIFLSLSSLEGGPIPLLEAMRFGLIPVVTNTGFAKDIITPSIDGIILELPLDSIKVVEAIKKTDDIARESLNRVNHLTWDRMRGLLIDDLDHFERRKNAR
jgi:glycosyltransferase involved in cell wall biosynthesis